MINYKEIRNAVAQGLKKHLGVPVIRGNQTAEAPPYPYAVYNVTTIAGRNNGTYQKHADGIDRLLVRSIWSFSFLSKDWDESVILATMAREWFLHSGRTWMSDRGIIVQSATDITNRDNILTVDYERKNGFDVVFYMFDEAGDPAESTDIGYINNAEFALKTSD